MAARNGLDGAEAARIMYGQTGERPMSEIIKELTKPWQKDEIKWRVGSISKDKKKALPLAYVDARTVMDRLDRVLGATNWQDRYEFPGVRSICYLSLRIEGEWLCKSDGAGDTDVEGEKGGISDAFKRAAVKWGMGRELYELKCRWMPIDEHKQLIGDPWKFVIKSEDAQKEPEPKKIEYNPNEETEKYIKEIKVITSKDAFIKFWNDQESRNRRGKIKSADVNLYNKVNDAKDEKLDSFNNYKGV